MPEIDRSDVVPTAAASGSPGPIEVSGQAGPAHRDVDEIVARAMADEATATRARLRLRTEAWTPLPPDDSIAPHLGAGELALAVRRSAALGEPASGMRAPPHAAGDLYLTSRRLVLVGRDIRAFDLAEIEDVLLYGEWLEVAMRDGSSFTLDVEGPRLFRVEIAAARAALRG